MERILVGLYPEDNGVWAGIHALNLAKRIHAKVSFLLVLDPGPDNRTRVLQQQRKTIMLKNLGALIEQGRSEGIGIDTFVIYGIYDEEVVEFIKANKITLLVVGLPSESEGNSGQFADLLEKLRHRIDCRIEVVHEKRVKPTTKRRS